MTGFARAAAVAACLAGCATTTGQVLPEHELAQRSAVEYDASFDEVYDAAWLALEKTGHRVEAHDRRQGTFATVASGRGYEVQATPRETRVRLELVPRHDPHGPAVLDPGEPERWKAVHAQVRALLDAWKTSPEFDYLKVGHAVVAVGVRLPMPPTWNSVELRTDRRRFKLQIFKRANEGTNPTLLVELDRRRPNDTPLALAQEAAGLAVPDAHFEFPEAPEPHGVKLRDGLLATAWDFQVKAEPFDLDVQALLTETFAWTIRLAAACPRPATPENLPDPACVRAVKSVFERSGHAAEP